MNRKITNKGELLIFVEDTDGNKFGGFMTQGFHIQESFFGTGESFIFKVEKEENSEEVYVYVASTINDMYCLADLDGFGFGSDPHYGLFIDQNLRKGFTFECKTYKNEKLSPKNHFSINKLEIWGFRPVEEEQAIMI